MIWKSSSGRSRSVWKMLKGGEGEKRHCQLRASLEVREELGSRRGIRDGIC